MSEARLGEHARRAARRAAARRRCTRSTRRSCSARATTCAKNGFTDVVIGAVGRHRLVARGRDRGRRARARARRRACSCRRASRARAASPTPRRSRPTSASARVTVPIEAAHAAFLDMLAEHVRRHRTRARGGEPPGADPRHDPDDDVEQVRLARPHHRQQERDGHRLLDALRRHGRRLRRHQGRAQDAGVRARARPQRARAAARSSPTPCSRSRRAPSCGPTSRTPTRCPSTRCSTRSSRATWRTTCRSPSSRRPGFDAETVRRVARLVDRNEYKRRQAPPGVRVSPKAFGKDRRLPITNRWPG